MSLIVLWIYPHINPVLVSIGPLAIRWYALAYIGGFCAGWLWLCRIVRQEHLWGDMARPTPASLDDLLGYCALGVIIGGRLGEVLLYNPRYYFYHPWEIVQLWHGGMAFHGGMMGALCGVIVFARKHEQRVLTVLDLTCLVAPIGIAFGRLANFLRPELWGRPTDVPWAMIFPSVDDLPRHPSQLYEAGLEGVLNLCLLAILVRYKALQRPGLVTGAFGVIYGLARIFCEFFRDPDPGLEKLGSWLTMGMLLSAPMVVIGFSMIVWSVLRRAKAV